MRPDVAFGPYRFDPSTGQLWSGGWEVRLTPKASAVLGALVTRAGQPVTKEELFAIVWPDTLVSDDALTSCIQEVRKALADDAKEPRFIETRHRRGYRFIAHLVEDTHDQAAGDVQSPGHDLTSIAVLPFADMSPGRDQDYLCEGLAEEIINALTHVDGLRVAARSASFQFRGPAVDVRAAGQQLGVATLLEGSVRKTNDRLRITLQLVEITNGCHRWSQCFERGLDDVFAIQDEIAEAVATSLRGVLSQREKSALQRPKTAAKTYEYYLRGRQHVHCLRQSDLEPSREMFERAIELDADYAPAWAGLAMLHATIYEWWGANDDDLERADRASRRALELAPGLADAHVARGLALSLKRCYDEAERAFNEAVRISPKLFDAYYHYARACFARGEVERSAQLFHKAAEVRHEDFQSLVLLAQSLRMLGRADEAQLANREGVARAECLLALNADDGRVLSLGSIALFNDGQQERAMEWSRRSLELYPHEVSILINGACLRARAGLKNDALELLERVFGHGWGKRDWVEHDPDYDSLRDDPRFKKLLAKLK